MIGLNDFCTMDPQMLYSMVNMKLRDYYEDLDDLARSEGIDRTALEQRRSITVAFIRTLLKPIS